MRPDVFRQEYIEEATYSDVSVRYICGGSEHPDHDTICTFRGNNNTAFKEVFLKVLMYAQELGHFKKVGGISIDGTKIKANASKHSAVSYKRAEEMIKQLEIEIEELVKKTEEADCSNNDNGLSIPEEIKSHVGKNLSLLPRLRKEKHSTILPILKAKL